MTGVDCSEKEVAPRLSWRKVATLTGVALGTCLLAPLTISCDARGPLTGEVCAPATGGSNLRGRRLMAHSAVHTVVHHVHHVYHGLHGMHHHIFGGSLVKGAPAHVDSKVYGPDAAQYVSDRHDGTHLGSHVDHGATYHSGGWGALADNDASSHHYTDLSDYNDAGYIGGSSQHWGDLADSHVGLSGGSHHWTTHFTDHDDGTVVSTHPHHHHVFHHIEKSDIGFLHGGRHHWVHEDIGGGAYYGGHAHWGNLAGAEQIDCSHHADNWYYAWDAHKKATCCSVAHVGCPGTWHQPDHGLGAMWGTYLNGKHPAHASDHWVSATPGDHWITSVDGGFLNGKRPAEVSTDHWVDSDTVDGGFLNGKGPADVSDQFLDSNTVDDGAFTDSGDLGDATTVDDGAFTDSGDLGDATTVDDGAVTDSGDLGDATTVDDGAVTDSGDLGDATTVDDEEKKK